MPDDVRLRLQALSAPAEPPPPSRRGWPSAPPGTPGAGLGYDDEAGAWRPEAEAWRAPDGESWRPGAEAWRAPDPEPWRAQPGPSAWDPPRGLARWLPASWVAARWDPGRWGAIGLGAVAALAAVIAAVGVWSGRPVAEPVPDLPVVAAAAPVSSAADPGPVAPASGPVIVNVAGKVRRPGLVTMREGARVGEAVEAAGGALPAVDLTPLNLAARVVDGQQIVVGAPAPAPAAAAPAAPGAAPAAAPGGKLDLNAASLEQLDALPGVGPVTAKKILDWRTQNGRFTAVEQLREIPGIGDARFGTLRDVVRV